jgi:choline dehydrogenase
LAATPFDEVRDSELVPGPDVVSDDEIEHFIQDRCEAFYHPVGTCRMGEDETANVVDSQLRVHGTTALRVADASVMPKIVRGNTNAPTMMIGARAVEFVLG